MTSPAIGKALESGLVVLYVSLVTTALFAGVVPEYRTTAGDAVADRTVATVAERIQQAIPPARTAVRANYRVTVPSTIAGTSYRITVVGEVLRLDHPSPGIGGSVRLALPPTVVAVRGGWESGGGARIVVESVPGGLGVWLEEP